MSLLSSVVAMSGLLLCLQCAHAQSTDAERVNIESKRQKVQAGFAIEDAACHARFAVNNCLININTKRREALADLRRQEVSLSDDERKKRGAEQVRRVEEKLSDTHRQESRDRRALLVSEYEVRSKRETEARKNKEDRIDANNRSSASPVDKRTRKKRISATGLSISDVRAANRYFDRQNQARERQLRYDAAANKRSSAGAKPLPVPP